jgi:hypothetical protein
MHHEISRYKKGSVHNRKVMYRIGKGNMKALTFRTSGLWLLKASNNAGRNVGNLSINSSWERRPTSCTIITRKQLSTIFVQAKAIQNTNKQNSNQILKQTLFLHTTRYFLFFLSSSARELHVISLKQREKVQRQRLLLPNNLDYKRATIIRTKFISTNMIFSNFYFIFLQPVNMTLLNVALGNYQKNVKYQKAQID